MDSSNDNRLIAIMLGRLGMTVDECLDDYLTLFERLAVKHTTDHKETEPGFQAIRASILRASVLDMVQRRGLEPATLLRNDDNISCYT